MNLPETILLIKTIDTNYRIPAKSEKHLEELARTMLKVLEPYNYRDIEKAAIEFMRNGNAFPPNAGQLISLAKEIRRAEYDERQRQISQLPEPERKREPCPPELMEKMQNLFKMPV